MALVKLQILLIERFVRLDDGPSALIRTNRMAALAMRQPAAATELPASDEEGWRQLWHGHPGHDWTRAGCPCHVPALNGAVKLPASDEEGWRAERRGG